MVTIEASSTTISWAITTTARIDQRLGSGSVAVVAPPCRGAISCHQVVVHADLLIETGG